MHLRSLAAATTALLLGCAPTAEAWLSADAQVEVSPDELALGFIPVDQATATAFTITNVGAAEATLTASVQDAPASLSERSWTAAPGQTVGSVLTTLAEQTGAIDGVVVVYRDGAEAARIPLSAQVTAQDTGR